MSLSARKFTGQQESDDFTIAHVDRERGGRAEERRRQHEVDLHLPGGKRREALSHRKTDLGHRTVSCRGVNVVLHKKFIR